MSNNKNNYLSTAKGIGIILMVMGHSGVPCNIDKFIYQFHMPLFFFCSGYFINIIEDRRTLLVFYKKKIKGIYLKFICWSILFLLLHNIFIDLNIYNNAIPNWEEYPYNSQLFIKKAVKIIFSMNGHEQLLRSFWFLKQLLLASLLVSTILYFSQKITQHKHTHLISLIGLSILTLISKKFTWSLPAIWDISLVFMSSTFFLFGYIFRKYNVIKKLSNIISSVISLILLFIGLYILPWTNMLEYTLATTVPFFIVAISGIVLTINISQKIESFRIKYFFYYLGQNTMPIFALHMLCFKIGNLLKIVIYGLPLYRLAEFQIIEDYNTCFWIIYTVIGISVPLLIDYLMKQSNTTKKIWNCFV